MSRARYRVTAGSPTQLGAVADARGVNFAVFSANATRVDICLFDEDGREESARIPLPEFTDQVWHGHVAGLKPGQLYGLRVHGPYAPAEGHRFNPNKLLIDPYAKGLTGNPEWRDEHFGYVVGSGSDDIVDERDSAPFTPKCVVPAKAPSRWKPRLRFGKKAFAPTAWADTIIYEAHVKGLTQLSEAVPAQSRGTFAALGHPSVVEYLLKLGVTTVELQPVQAFAHDRYLQEKDLRNYWGYSPLNYFAPMTDYLGPGGIDDVSEAVQQLHSAGIEVILDVVYNHTCEGNHLGPTISFRGIDNASYYKLSDDPRFYFDTTGCGNTLNIGTPRVLQLVTDSLRHWVEAYGIDGFRFDLATTLARDDRSFSANSTFLAALRQDPVLSAKKLIAESWDLGEDSYQVGNFPPGWAEWNGRFRDDVRSFWKGEDHTLPALSRAFLGSADLFDKDGRKPWSSVNFITAHDGFTLHDLYAYNDKHNEANGEDNRDGHDDNRSWNCGAEGETGDEAINDLRAQLRRSAMATLILSQGTPMLLMGDENGRTQNGNNNAYCQDNALNWMNWQGDADGDLLEFTSQLLALRKQHPILRQTQFLHGEDVGPKARTVTWVRADGADMQPDDWSNGHNRSLGLLMSERSGNSMFLMVNAHHEGVAFSLPRPGKLKSWRMIVSTARGIVDDNGIETFEPKDELIVPGRALYLLAGRWK